MNLSNLLAIKRTELNQATKQEILRREAEKPLIAFKQNGIYYYWTVAVTTDRAFVEEQITRRGGKVITDVKINVPKRICSRTRKV